MPATHFTNVKIIDGDGTEPYLGEVLVEGNRIKSVAKTAGEITGDGTRSVDGGGQTLMPGLIESHAHISFCNTADLESLGDIPPEEHTLEAMKFAKVMLDQGFTSIFSAAAAKARLDVVIRNAIDAGDIPGPADARRQPRVNSDERAGRRAPPSHMHRETFAITCDGADEFRQAPRARWCARAWIP